MLSLSRFKQCENALLILRIDLLGVRKSEIYFWVYLGGDHIAQKGSKMWGNR